MITNTAPVVVLTNDDSTSWDSWDHETEGKTWSNGGQQPLPPGAANSDSQNCYIDHVRNNTAGPGPSSSRHYVAPGRPPHSQNNSGEQARPGALNEHYYQRHHHHNSNPHLYEQQQQPHAFPSSFPANWPTEQQTHGAGVYNVNCEENERSVLRRYPDDRSTNNCTYSQPYYYNNCHDHGAGTSCGADPARTCCCWQHSSARPSSSDHHARCLPPSRPPSHPSSYSAQGYSKAYASTRPVPAASTHPHRRYHHDEYHHLSYSNERTYSTAMPTHPYHQMPVPPAAPTQPPLCCNQVHHIHDACWHGEAAVCCHSTTSGLADYSRHSRKDKRRVSQESLPLSRAYDDDEEVEKEPKRKKAKKKRKLKVADDQPRRPFSAYNFFFSEEKDIVINMLPAKQTDTTTTSAGGNVCDMDIEAIQEYLVEAQLKLSTEVFAALRKTVEKQTERTLLEHLEGDRAKKPHKKSHGKISLQKLAGVVGRRWRDLSDGDKKRYFALAKADQDRFKKQMDHQLGEKKASPSSTGNTIASGTSSLTKELSMPPLVEEV